jgi:sulfate/thiosulfate transport system substrate-binding protein
MGFWKHLLPNRRLKRWLTCALVGLCTSLTIAACTPTRSNITELTLVSFAVTRSAHTNLIPKFAAKWKRETGQTVRFIQGYGGSGAQTRAVLDGLDADIVHLALGLDLKKIEKAGLINPGWESEAPNNSIVSKSVAALITRPGNPKNITSWNDLARPDVTWVTADPKTSGIARWNFMTLWHNAIQSGKDETQAQTFMTQAFKNVPVLPRDAREANDAFLNQNQGDALINYENEILLALSRGQKANYTIPDVNISIENPIAVVDKNVDKNGHRQVAEAYLKYLFTPEAQAEFAKAGFRPITPQQSQLSTKFPPVKHLGTIQDYGGWDKAQQQFFGDGAMFEQIRPQ